MVNRERFVGLLGLTTIASGSSTFGSAKLLITDPRRAAALGSDRKLSRSPIAPVSARSPSLCSG